MHRNFRSTDDPRRHGYHACAAPPTRKRMTVLNASSAMNASPLVVVLVLFRGLDLGMMKRRSDSNVCSMDKYTSFRCSSWR